MFKFSIPCANGDYSVSLTTGRTLFVLGPNGSGKSSLLQHLAKHVPNLDAIKWIRAHRRSWMASSMLEITFSELQKQQAYQTQYMRRDDARYLIHDDGFDTQSSIALLVQRQNADARQVKDMIMEKRYCDATTFAEDRDILRSLNSALEQSNIPIVVSVGDKDNVLATKDGSTYGVNEMSDGERSVLLLAASILTADEGTCFLLDEPERHLHRAIISPLLSTLFRSRDDCSFVVSTHEVALPLDNPDADVMLVRRCHFDNGIPMKWDFDLIKEPGNILEVVRESILGARRKVIFVEGEKSSLDFPLYARIFEDASVVPAGGRRRVINAVRSIRMSSSYHGINAFGLVDGDYLDEDDVECLGRQGIFVVDGYAVESIYYDSEVQRMVVRKTLDEEEAQQRLENARKRVLDTFRKTEIAERMFQSRAKERRRKMVLVEIEKLELTETTLELCGVAILQDEKERLESNVEAGRVDRLIREYPIKRSPALTDIAKELGFRDRKTYESAVVHLLGSSCKALMYVRKRFEELLRAMD